MRGGGGDRSEVLLVKIYDGLLVRNIFFAM